MNNATKSVISGLFVLLASFALGEVALRAAQALPVRAVSPDDVAEVQ